MAKALESTCTNHPGVAAVGRCKQCGKPFCTTCRIQGPTGRFCSEACKEQHQEFVKRAARLDDRRRDTSFFAKIWIRLKKTAVYLLAALIVLVVLHFFGIYIPLVSDQIERWQ